MLFAYFFEPENMFFNVSDVYDAGFYHTISPIMDYTSIITIIFTFILIIIIIQKTPRQMASFRTYLLPYVINALMLEVMMLLAKPSMLHPFMAIISVEPLISLNRHLLLILFVLILYFAMSLVDCVAGMSAERFFAMKAKTLGRQSKKPMIIFSVLAVSNLIFLIAGIICVSIPGLVDAFIAPADEAMAYLSGHVLGSSEGLLKVPIILFKPSNSGLLLIGVIGFLFFAFSRYLTATIFLVLNAYTSFQATVISKKLQRNNAMLLRCTYFQFSGFIFLAGLPVVLIVVAMACYTSPSKLPTFCMLAMNSFGLYDTFVTIICIRPYRMFFVNIFRKDNKTIAETSYGPRTIRITSFS